MGKMSDAADWIGFAGCPISGRRCWLASGPGQGCGSRAAAARGGSGLERFWPVRWRALVNYGLPAPVGADKTCPQRRLATRDPVAGPPPLAGSDREHLSLTRKKNNPDTETNVPKAVVSRLSLYLRELQRFVRGGGATISSNQLGQMLGITDAQVRKDFAVFGQFGYPGIGYRCNELIEEIRQILGTDRIWPVALVGCGNLGQALLGYRGFDQQGFSVVLAFDSDTQLVGTEIGDLTVRDLSRLAEDLSENEVRMAILAVPAGSAQQVADRLIEAGITGILNFAPVTLSVPDEVSIAEVDLAIELEQLSFAVVKHLDK